MVIAQLFVGSALRPRCERLRQTTPLPSPSAQGRVTRRTSQLPAKERTDPPQLSFHNVARRAAPRSNSTSYELDPRIPLPRIIIAPRAKHRASWRHAGEEGDGTGYRSREAQPPSFLRDEGIFATRGRRKAKQVMVVGASKIIVLTGSKVSASRGFSLGKLEIRKPGGVLVTDLTIIITGGIKSPGWISK